MIQVAIITISQRDILVNIGEIQNFGYILPIKDINDNFFLSQNEYYYFLGLWYLDELNSELVFIKDLSLSVYEPKIVENPLM